MLLYFIGNKYQNRILPKDGKILNILTIHFSFSIFYKPLFELLHMKYIRSINQHYSNQLLFLNPNVNTIPVFQGPETRSRDTWELFSLHSGKKKIWSSLWLFACEVILQCAICNAYVPKYVYNSYFKEKIMQTFILCKKIPKVLHAILCARF